MMIDTSEFCSLPERHHLMVVAGSCSPNPGTGGWAVLSQLREGNTSIRQNLQSGMEDNTTNNRMVLRALQRALERVQEDELPIWVVTDSTYLRDGVCVHLPKWVDNGWRGSKGKPTRNREFWMALNDLRLDRIVAWTRLSSVAQSDALDVASAAAERVRTMGAFA